MIGEGKAKDAIGMIQNGMKKPLKDPPTPRSVWARPISPPARRRDAEAAFNKVKTPEKDAMVAHLWALAAHH